MWGLGFWDRVRVSGLMSGLGLMLGWKITAEVLGVKIRISV